MATNQSSTNNDDTVTGASPTQLNGFQRDLLRAVELADGENGQVVKDVLTSNGYGSINHGRLYPNLDTLSRHGLIDKRPHNRRSHSYSITEFGIEVLDDYVQFLGGRP